MLARGGHKDRQVRWVAAMREVHKVLRDRDSFGEWTSRLPAAGVIRALLPPPNIKVLL